MNSTTMYYNIIKSKNQKNFNLFNYIRVCIQIMEKYALK